MSSSSIQRSGHVGLGRRRLHTLYVVAATGLAALVPLLLFAGVWIRSELGKSQRDVELFLRARAVALSQRVDAEIDQQLSAMRALSALPSLDENPAAFEDAARRITAVMPHWSSLNLIGADTLKPLFSTAPEVLGQPNEKCLRETMERRRPLIETRSPGARREGDILLMMPVLRNNAVRYVLVTTFDRGELQRLVSGQSRESQLSYRVLSSEDVVLAEAPEVTGGVGQEVPSSLKTAVAGARPEGLFESTARDGEPLLSAFARSGLTSWVAIATLGSKQTGLMVAGSGLAPIAAGALSLMIAGILAVFIMHTIMERRFSEERLAASRALGDLDARLLATSQEALGEQRKAASEREVLLREIYHRVKNNLQIVQSLLRLGSRELKPDQREPFESAVRRIGAMSRVHTLLYNSPDLASIDFKDYLEELLKELSEGFAADERKIQSVLNADAMRMPLDTAVPLAFIAVEILTNAFKHAFPEGRSGQITVEIEREGDTALLRIKDDGVGLTHDAASKRRLGLTIVRKLVQQIGGTLEEPPPGSSVFAIRFPHDGTGAGPEASSKLAQMEGENASRAAPAGA